MITAETIPETTEIEIKPEDADKLYSLIFGSNEFSPSALMAQTLAEYITQEDNLLPHQILKKNGRARENWYIWSKRKGFLDWWNGVIDGVFSKQRLGDLYSALYRRGLSNDTAAAKVFLQRYDPKYTERSQQDIRGVFAGYEPTEAQDSRERQRKALAVVEALPEPRQGVGHVYAGLARALQAQAHADTQHIEPGTPACNDETLDFKPVTKVDPPGGGL